MKRIVPGEKRWRRWRRGGREGEKVLIRRKYLCRKDHGTFNKMNCSGVDGALGRLTGHRQGEGKRLHYDPILYKEFKLHSIGGRELLENARWLNATVECFRKIAVMVRGSGREAVEQHWKREKMRAGLRAI